MQRICKICGQNFEISEEDLSFYDRVSPSFAGIKCPIPTPSLCPDCRQQRRLAFRNERTLYKRTCDFSGKPIVSIYAPGTGLKVYDKEIWYSDKWNGLSFGRAFDFARPFFSQFKELHDCVPMLAINHQTENDNCEYCNFISYDRNCYFIFAANDCENCYYSTYLQRCRDVCDCFFVFDCELCYECIDCYSCYNTQFSWYCYNCIDSSFLSNCRACSHCVGCVSLQNKRYCLFNQQLSKEEYHRKIGELLKRADHINYCQERVKELSKTSPHKHYSGINNEDVSGDHLSFSMNSQSCYDCTYLEDCKYCTWLHRARDCYDCYAWGLPAELSYENHLRGNSYYHLLFCESCWNDVSELIYCRYCTNGSKQLFGCVGLQRQEYCVLNRQYSKEDYQALVSRIAHHMKETGEWGEFFPMSLSPFAYNETVTQEYFPLSPQDVHDKGLAWTDSIPRTEGRETLTWAEIPRSIKDVTASICDKVLACVSCHKNFRITNPEFRFYQKLQLPIPQNCFDCRYSFRRKRRNPRKLGERCCEKCGNKVLSTYTLTRPELVYCEQCYHSD